MRDTRSSSVGPTASVSMLKPRRANSPAIRVRTPGLFSTRMDRMCLRPVRTPPAASSWSSERISWVAGSPISCWLRCPPSAHHVPGRLAGRDHRIGVLLTRDPHVDEDGPLGGQYVPDIGD